MMTTEVEVIHPDQTLAEAAEKMKALDVGPLPVCDGERLVGMITDRDITVRATAAGRDPKSTRVRDVMTEQIFYCFEDDSLEQAAEILERAQIRRMPVLNQAKRLVGIVALGDLAVQSEDEELVGEVLGRVSEPAAPAARR